MTKIREIEKRDLKRVQEIEEAIFQKPWSLENLGYYLNHDHYYGYVAEEQDTLSGFIFLSVSDQVEVDQIAVSKEKRNRGIGGQLLEKIDEVAQKEKVEKAYLEVRSSNEPAISLYENFGFQKIALRKNYYDNPPEDAVLYQKEIQ